MPVTVTRRSAPAPPLPAAPANGSGSVSQQSGGAFSRLGDLGADNPIGWRASLRAPSVGMGVLGKARERGAT